MGDVVIIIFCDEGLGDQYASFITAYNLIPILKKQGYNPKIFISKEHKYFSVKTPVSVIYNISVFDCEIEEMRYSEIMKHLKDYRKLSFSSIQVWVPFNLTELNNLEYSNITRYNLHNISIHPNIINNFYNKDVFEKAEEFISGKKEIVTLHFRSGDELMTANFDQIIRNGFWGNQFEKSYKFIEQHMEFDVMVCSSNPNITKHFCEKYENVFSNKFSYPDLEMHRIYGYEDTKDDSIYIEHTKEIMAEMVSMMYSKRILSINHFSSNFILYGILNNINYTTWQDKLSNLIYYNNV